MEWERISFENPRVEEQNEVDVEKTLQIQEMSVFYNNNKPASAVFVFYL